MTAHPGAFCSPVGGTDKTNAGTDMVCSVGAPGQRARWRRNGPAPARAPRRRRAARGGGSQPLPQVNAGIDPTTGPKNEVPEAADAQAAKTNWRNTPHESDRTGPDADCTICGLPTANGVHTNSARHSDWLTHKDLVQRAGGPKRPDESMEEYDARLNPHRADDNPAKAAENGPMTDQEAADKIRQAYLGQPDRWMAMKDVASQTGLTPDQIARGTRKLMEDDNFRAEPEPFGHRVQEDDRAVSPVIGGEARHKLSFMDRVQAVPKATPDAQAKNADISDRIREAYNDLGAKQDRLPGMGPATVRLRDLRDKLADLPQEDVDKALNDLIKSPDVRMTSELDQRKLTDADRGAAVTIGGEARHMLRIEPKG